MIMETVTPSRSCLAPLARFPKLEIEADVGAFALDGFLKKHCVHLPFAGRAPGPLRRGGGCDRELHADADGRVHASRSAIIYSIPARLSAFVSRASGDFAPRRCS